MDYDPLDDPEVRAVIAEHRREVDKMLAKCAAEIEASLKMLAIEIEHSFGPSTDRRPEGGAAIGVSRPAPPPFDRGRRSA